MSSQAWLPAICSNENLYYPAQIEQGRGYLGSLSRMDAEKFFSFCLWHYAEGSEFVAPTSLANYLQTAGSADRLTVELRETGADGSHTHWVLGRAAVTGTESEAVAWNGRTTHVHPEEVWTAEQAAPLFEQYSAERTVPDWVNRRVLDL